VGSTALETDRRRDKGLRTFLREKVAGIAHDDKTTIIGTPVGRDALLAQLSDEMIPYTPEELDRHGEGADGLVQATDA
jgi:hypothetical protein